MPGMNRTGRGTAFAPATTWIAAGVFVAACMAGCANPAPRFRSNGSEAGGSDRGNEERIASEIRREEAVEDDRKVDVAAVSKNLTARPVATAKHANLTPKGLDRDKVLLDVVSFLGVPYVYGGSTKRGIDCSGFTLWVYAHAVQRQLPRSAEDQYGMGTPVLTDSLEFGDLVFFNTTGAAPSHVGIYIEDDIFAHASVSSGVTLSSLESSYFKRRYVGARRIVR